MGLMCKVGLHRWNGCKCTVCLHTRDEGHDWSKNCGLCSRCKKVRVDAHKWDGCKCTICSSQRNYGHDLNGCKCNKCGAIDHEVKFCKCQRCNEILSNDHEWKNSKCVHCGKALDFKGLTLQESQLLYPLLDRIKAYCKSSASTVSSDSFGGVCDRCSGNVTIDNFYLQSGKGLCEACLNRSLYDNDNWYYYLEHLDQWICYLPRTYSQEAVEIRRSIDKMRETK